MYRPACVKLYISVQCIPNGDEIQMANVIDPEIHYYSFKLIRLYIELSLSTSKLNYLFQLNVLIVVIFMC